MFLLAALLLAPYVTIMTSTLTSTLGDVMPPEMKENFQNLTEILNDGFWTATDSLNQTANHFMTNDWPRYSNQTSVAYERFKNDPDNWIILYPLTMLFAAVLIMACAPSVQRMPAENLPEDTLEDNILVRRRRSNGMTFILTDKREQRTHPMILRSMRPVSFYQVS